MRIVKVTSRIVAAGAAISMTAAAAFAGNVFEFEAVYTGEVFSNLQGGIGTDDATEYRGNTDLTITIDAGELGLPEGGSFLIYGQTGHGTSISEYHVGDFQALSNMDADEFTQVSEYWFEQNFASDRMRLKLGKQDANADFCAVDNGGDFINSSFGLIPTAPMPTFPDPALGAAFFADIFGPLSIGAGIYDGAPDGGTAGMDSAFDGDEGSMTLFEATFSPEFGAGGDYQGVYRLGFWHHSHEFAELSGSETFDGCNGFYVACDQQVYSGENAGIGLFAQAGWAPEDRMEISSYFGGGLLATGFLPGGDNDRFGFGVARAGLSSELADDLAGATETSVELFYKAELSDRFVVQPDIQYILSPGGAGDDALAAGLRFECSF